MNKKGQIVIGLITAIFIWVAGIMILPLIMDMMDTARTGLQCATPSLISDGTKLLCLISDTGAIIFIWTIISIILGIIVGGRR